MDHCFMLRGRDAIYQPTGVGPPMSVILEGKGKVIDQYCFYTYLQNSVKGPF